MPIPSRGDILWCISDLEADNGMRLPIRPRRLYVVKKIVQLGGPRYGLILDSDNRQVALGLPRVLLDKAFRILFMPSRPPCHSDRQELRKAYQALGRQVFVDARNSMLNAEMSRGRDDIPVFRGYEAQGHGTKSL